MIRLFEVAIIAATLVVAVALYAFKYDTGHLAKDITRLKAEIADEEAALNVLRAEWSLLNQPDRLQKMAERHLELEPLSGSQIRDFASLPEKPPHEAMDDLVRRALGPSTVFEAPARDAAR